MSMQVIDGDFVLLHDRFSDSIVFDFLPHIPLDLELWIRRRCAPNQLCIGFPQSRDDLLMGLLVLFGTRRRRSVEGSRPCHFT